MNPKKTTRNPAIEKAIKFLQVAFDQDTWKMGNRLPTCLTLSRMADVSNKTMWKAITILKEKKLVAFKEKVGIFRGPVLPERSVPKCIEKPIMKCEKIKDRLMQSIFSGHYQTSGKLPSVKELCEEFGTSSQLIRKACGQLEKDNIIKRYKRGYLVIKFGRAKTYNSIFLFVNESTHVDSLWSFDRDQYNLFLRSLENACHHRKLSLIKVPYTSLKRINTSFDKSIGSIIFGSTDNSDKVPFESTLNTVSQVVRSNKPVTLFSGYANINEDYINALRKHDNARNLFYSDLSVNKKAGQSVGRFLLEKGHTKICFFAPDSNPVYADRYEGIDKVFSQSGIPYTIHFLSPKNPQGNDPAIMEYLSGATALPINQLREEVTFGTFLTWKTPTETPIKQIIRQQYDALLKTLSMDPHRNQDNIVMPDALSFDDMLESLGVIYKMRIPQQLKGPVINHMQECQNNFMLKRTFNTLFRKALLQKDVTAWVCAEDYLTNFAALEFLNGQNIKIPERMGLMGFQDHFQSYANNISSYHFDIAGIAQKMLHLILYPQHSQRLFCHKDTRIFEYDGMVIDRGSA